MDNKEILAAYLEVRAELVAQQQILAQAMGMLLAGEPNPPKAATEVFERCSARLDQLPIKAPMPEGDAFIEDVRQRLAIFFTALRDALGTRRGGAPPPR